MAVKNQVVIVLVERNVSSYVSCPFLTLIYVPRHGSSPFHRSLDIQS
jgi:hypothetical protein